ncbi:MAG: hypothetical protein OXG60_16455 [Chloroflexi bacterium]|nr:hypothetical protein [Chloroflexota bacterium]
MSNEDSSPSDLEPKSTLSSDISIPRELIDALPEEKRQELLEKFEQDIVHVRSEEYYSGPDVHPELAARWESLVPGSAKALFEQSIKRQNHNMDSQDRILTIAEELNSHRIELETQSQKDAAELDRSVIGTIASREQKGQWFAFIAVLVITVGSFYMVHAGHNVVGISVLIFEAAGVAGVFLYQVRAKRNQLLQAGEHQNQLPSVPDQHDHKP